MKLVKEHINFQRGLDPKEAMGIGMTKEVLREKILSTDPNIGKKLKIGWAVTRSGYYSGVSSATKTIWDEYAIDQLTHEGLKELYRQIVYNITESVNFQRGLDPKDAMGIGEVTNINHRMHQLKELDEKEEGIIMEINAIVDDDRYDGLWITTHNWPGPQKSYLRYLLKEVNLSKYIKGIIEETSCEEDSHYKCGTREYRYEIKPQFKKYFEDTDQINESINFQRGLDPKDAMGIGDIKKREEDRILKKMRLYMRTAMKIYAPSKKLHYKESQHGPAPGEDPELKYKSYSFFINDKRDNTKIFITLRYYFNMPLWDLELVYGYLPDKRNRAGGRFIHLETTLKDFVKEVRLLMQDDLEYEAS